MRNVYKIYDINDRHWVGNGFLVKTLFSARSKDFNIDPFLMFDYAAPRQFPANPENRSRGVGEHPHKGFETVTIAYHGEVAHKDSNGGNGVIKAGDVQWMTAGSGILHEEFHSDEFSKTGGLFEMVQLWVNLPAKYKNTAPNYQHIKNEDIPVINFANNAGFMRLIAGNYLDIKGAAKTFTEMNVWDIFVNVNQEIELNIPNNHNLMMVVLRGEPVINDNNLATSGQLIAFVNNDEEKIKIKANDYEVKILLLSGVPINEPIAAQGPFVMNTQEEIEQAILDFKNGNFGKIDH